MLSVLLVGAGAVGPAAAHDDLVGSEPTDGATVEQAPESLVLTFSGAVSELGTQVVVTGPDGSPVSEGEPAVDGDRVEQELADDLAAGGYTVLWRVTSEDGHPISGELGFTVTEASSTESASTESAGTGTTSTESAGTGTTSSAPTVDPTPVADETSGSGDGMPTWAWIAIGVAALALAGALATTYARGRG
ncbi:hypothetical protein GCM10011366_26270 [Ornithinimicrobium tianjinense]|uniref:CopC domain-containing protein n=2 Tax=Ornithinimicrobium tianjinense TaxID=1195761 RepID=A0A917F763_9MICO|nr:hypothetical protein GCM10011366_26270 [Ornithinimicrobium tianjinense]